MNIPVQNLYHLLTYAWDQLDEAETVAVSAEPADQLLDLLARVLVQGTTHVLKRGLARDYVPEQELTGRLRGKLLIGESIRQQTLPTARAWCAFDELSYDVPVNRLLKSALYHLLTAPVLAEPLRREVRALYVRLADVALVPVRDLRVYECKLPPKVSQSKPERSSNLSLLLFLTVYEKKPIQRSPDTGYFASTGPGPDGGSDLPGARH